MSEFRQYRRRLPHWRSEGAIYFVTWRVERGIADLDGAERGQVLRSLLHFNGVRYNLYAAVVMNDHVHALVEPTERVDLEEIIRAWKSFSARQFSHRVGRVWQPEYYDRIIRDERELEGATQYIASNPFRRWPDIESYPWLWIAGN
ncbi:MAG TPA: transposase [Candidatus Dormibacteraeota bacterium]|nr:transposase [Candidatus Dormibacteraeota bacterium]